MADGDLTPPADPQPIHLEDQEVEQKIKEVPKTSSAL